MSNPRANYSEALFEDLAARHPSKASAAREIGIHYNTLIQKIAADENFSAAWNRGMLKRPPELKNLRSKANREADELELIPKIELSDLDRKVWRSIKFGQSSLQSNRRRCETFGARNLRINRSSADRRRNMQKRLPEFYGVFRQKESAEKSPLPLKRQSLRS